MGVGTVLDRYLPETVAGEHAKLDGNALRAELETVRLSSAADFKVCVRMLIVIFTIACAMLVWYRGDAAVLSIVTGTGGVTVMGTVGYMVKLWREKYTADLIGVLCLNADEKQLLKLLKLLRPKV